MMWSFGIFCGNLVHFSCFWYFIPGKIWQPKYLLHNIVRWTPNLGRVWSIICKTEDTVFIIQWRHQDLVGWLDTDDVTTANAQEKWAGQMLTWYARLLWETGQFLQVKFEPMQGWRPSIRHSVLLKSVLTSRGERRGGCSRLGVRVQPQGS
jgi:hypothetical protein